jgi:Na+/H+ antiporter NhaD/arsenite permease-like protein
VKTFVILTGSILLILSSIIGLSSDIAGLTGYNIVETVKQFAPGSYIILFLVIVIMYLLVYIREIRKKLVKDHEETKLDFEPQEDFLSASDIKVLDKLFEIFSGSIMHHFFEYLADTRSVFINQTIDFHEAIKLFLSPHNRLRNENLEKAKVEFLTVFGEFLSYSTKFDSNNGVTARFKPKSDREEAEYLEIAKKTYKQWSDFLNTIAKEAPNYQIKD